MTTTNRLLSDEHDQEKYERGVREMTLFVGIVCIIIAVFMLGATTSTVRLILGVMLMLLAGALLGQAILA